VREKIISIIPAFKKKNENNNKSSGLMQDIPKKRLPISTSGELENLTEKKTEDCVIRSYLNNSHGKISRKNFM